MSTPYIIGTLNSATATTVSIPVTTPSRAGDSILIVSNKSGTATDTNGNAYTQIADVPQGSGLPMVALLSESPTPLQVGNTVTFNLTSSSAISVLVVGVPAGYVPDINTSNVGTSTAWSVNWPAPSAGYPEVLMLFECNGSYPPSAPASGFSTLNATLSGNGAGYLLSCYTTGETLAGSAGGNISTSIAWAAMALGFHVPLMTITPSSLPAAVVNVAYSQTLAVTGGAVSYTWALQSGSLPAGLSLSASGVISGTPTATGTSSFVVEVTDSQGNVATESLSLTVAAATTFTFPVGSAIPGTLAAFMSLATTTLPANSTVWFGEELPVYSAPVTLQITEIQGDQQPAEIGGRYRREETFSLICLLTCYQGGSQDFPTILGNVMSNFDLLALAIGANPSLTAPGAAVQVARYTEVGNFIITPTTDQNGMSAVTLSFALRCQQRVESVSGS